MIRNHERWLSIGANNAQINGSTLYVMDSYLANANVYTLFSFSRRLLQKQYPRAMRHIKHFRNAFKKNVCCDLVQSVFSWYLFRTIDAG